MVASNLKLGQRLTHVEKINAIGKSQDLAMTQNDRFNAQLNKATWKIGKLEGEITSSLSSALIWRPALADLPTSPLELIDLASLKVRMQMT
jgi:hypothetical protein